MLFNYFKTALRNITKNKANSFLNISGLAIGLAIAGLIFLWVEDEMNFDQFNAKKDQLYFVMVNQKYDSYVFTHWSTPGVMAPAMKAEIPGVANTCRVSEDQSRLLFTIGDKSMYASGRYTEASLFQMFTLPFVQGNASSAFRQLYSLVITEKTAHKFFGNDPNVVGKTVRVDNKQDYVISGVIKDLPENSSLQFEWLAPFEIYYQQSPWAHEWGNCCISTYIELKPGTDPANVDKQLYGFIQKRVPASISHPFLSSMNDWHLRGQFVDGKRTGGGQIQYVHLFSLIAWIILFIACINFMNLSTARSEKRAREVGVRKVLGAQRSKLVFQFIGEAMLMSFLAGIAAVMLILLVIPEFNVLVQKDLKVNPGDPLHLSVFFTITIICGLVAGSYPAFYLSSFNPVSVLKGFKLKTGSAAFIRKTLVVMQFSVSIMLIISTIIIYKQIHHVKNRQLGFNKDNLIEIDIQGELQNRFSAIKNDLLNSGLVENAALSDHVTLYGGNNTDGITWERKAPGSKILISGRSVTPDFFATSGMHLLEGRNLKETDTAFKEGNLTVVNFVITQSLARLMGKETAIGKTMRNEGDPSTIIRVVGVVNDYVYGNMYGKPDPVGFSVLPAHQATIMYVRIKPGNPEQAVHQIEKIAKRYNPAYPFEYRFVDDQFNQMFSSEVLVSKLSRLFAALAILISCLGLFGLAAYMAERRTKEIGIRKVLGASVSGIAGLLSKDFIRLVLLSALIAFPAAWWTMNNWLQNYQYRISISWWVFILSGTIAMFIAVATISWQAVKAAIANPVKSLRTE